MTENCVSWCLTGEEGALTSLSSIIHELNDYRKACIDEGRDAYVKCDTFYATNLAAMSKQIK